MADQPPAQAAEPAMIEEFRSWDRFNPLVEGAVAEHNALVAYARDLLRQKKVADLIADHWRDETKQLEHSLAQVNAALAASRAQTRAAVEALRGLVIKPWHSTGLRHCSHCYGGEWMPGKAERHADGCLAAPSKEGE